MKKYESLEEKFGKKTTEENKKIVFLYLNLEDYIILKGRKHGNYSYPDLLVAKNRIDFDGNWYDAHKELRKQDGFMLNLRQYVDFLNLLKSGIAYDGHGTQIYKNKLVGMFDRILETEAHSLGWTEYLDTSFLSSPLCVKYHNIKFDASDASLKEITEHLGEYLIEEREGNPLLKKYKKANQDEIDKEYKKGIDLNNWLKTADKHGLPNKNVMGGSINYKPPQKNKVCGFVSGDTVIIDCGTKEVRNPFYDVKQKNSPFPNILQKDEWEIRATSEKITKLPFINCSLNPKKEGLRFIRPAHILKQE